MGGNTLNSCNFTVLMLFPLKRKPKMLPCLIFVRRRSKNAYIKKINNSAVSNNRIIGFVR